MSGKLLVVCLKPLHGLLAEVLGVLLLEGQGLKREVGHLLEREEECAEAREDSELVVLEEGRYAALEDWVDVGHVQVGLVVVRLVRKREKF